MAHTFDKMVTLQQRETQRQQAEEKSERLVQQIIALRTIDVAVNTSRDLKKTLDIILDQVITQLGVDAADVLLLDGEMRQLEYRAERGFRTGALQHTKLPLGECYAGRAAQERRILSVLNLKETPDGFPRSSLLTSEDFCACFLVPLIAHGEIRGVLEVFDRETRIRDPEWHDFLETLAAQAAIAIDNTILFEDLQRANSELTVAYDTTLEGWTRALDLRDRGTEGHTQRVTDMTLRLARAIGIGEKEQVNLRRGALLHDIGKIGIPDAILLKPGPLTPAEWVLMRQHPVYAKEMLAPIAFLRSALEIPYCHHEKWDGTGYPRGLKGEEIPLSARIFAVVDVWDALGSDRPYGRALPEEQVIQRLRSLSGTHFDPQAVDLFFRIAQSES